MPVMIGLKNITKEEFLKSNALQISEEEFKKSSFSIFKDYGLLVCIHVQNPSMTSVVIIATEVEYEKWKKTPDSRGKIYFKIKEEVVKPYIKS